VSTLTQEARKDNVWVLGALATAVVIVPAAYWTGLRDYTLPPKLLVLQISLLAALAACLAGKRPVLRMPRPGLPAMAYLMTCALSILWALDRSAGMLELTRLVSGFLLFLVVSQIAISTFRDALLKCWVAAALPLSALGIAEYLGVSILEIPSAGLPSSTFGFRNIAAMYLIQTLPFAVAMLALARSRTWITVASLSTTAMLIFLLYTRTRGAWLGLSLGVAVTAVLMFTGRKALPGVHPPEKRRLTWGIASLVLAIGLGLLPSGMQKVGPQHIDEKKASVTDAATSVLRSDADRGRFAVWGHTIEMVRANPVMGVGLGNWSVHYPRFDRGDRVTFNTAPERPHNELLEILTETGIIGLACYLWLGLAAISLAWRGIRSDRLEIFWLAAACLCSLLAITVHGFFSFPGERVTPTMLFWLSLGLLAGIDRRQPAVSHISIRRVGLVVLLAVSTLQVFLSLKIIRFERHVYKATQAEARGDWAGVAREAATALDVGLFHPEAATLAGYALNRIGDYAASYHMYKEVTENRPYDIQLLNGMAIACQNLNRPDEAIHYYEQALAVVHDLPDVHYNLAGLLSANGRLEEAVSAYRRVTDLRPDDAQSHYALGLILEKTGRRAEAIESFRSFMDHWTGDRHYLATVARRIEQLTRLGTE
jgi:O-antigen ligase